MEILQTKHGIAGERLIRFIERVERLEEEKSILSIDIKEIYSEAKAEGYDIKIIRQIVQLRKKSITERQEQEAILEMYLAAIGEK